MLVLATLILLFFASPAAAEVISFERGGASDSTGIVAAGKIQLEQGFMDYATQGSNNRDDQFGIGSSLLRYGIVQDKFELRALSSGVIINEDKAGFDNLTLGTKINLLNPYLSSKKSKLPIIDLISSFEIPYGNTRLRNPGFNHSYKFLLSKPFQEKNEFLINIGPSFESNERANGSEFNSVSIPYVFNLSRWATNRLNIFTDVFGTWFTTSDFKNPVGVDVGFAYAIKDNLIFDITTFYGLNDEANDFALSFGLSFRP